MDYCFIKGTSPRLLVFFHGTGGNKESMLFLRQQLDPEDSVLSLDGSWGQGRDRRFFAPLIDGQLDLVDFELRLSAFLDFWQDLDIQPYQKITFVGFSNGANFIMGLLTKQSNLADNYILLHPSALDYAFPRENSRAEILFTLGQNDPYVDPVTLENLVDDWQALAFPRANLARFDKGHFLSQDELTYVRNWYQERTDKKA
ncbi:TPA: alpha/beta hydrolase [Streptococcus suis]|uniref:alpha/beta hydrolase n=1 Tax=Streptococcus suis TaxID=1307 RepID=UPI003708F173